MSRLQSAGRGPLVAVAVALAAGFAPAVAGAQPAPGAGTDTSFDVQTFWPTGGPSEHIALRGSTVSPSGAVGFGLIGGLMRRPLLLTPTAGGQQQAAVDWAFTTDFVWNVGILRRFQVSAAIPVVVAQSGDGTTPLLGSRGAALGDTALRDLRFEASWAIVQRARVPDATGFGLRLDLGGAVPFGDEKGFNSSGAFTFAPMLGADLRLRNLTFTVNAGARLREDRYFSNIVVGNTLVAGAGIAARPSATSRFATTVEYFGTFGLASAAGFVAPSTSELFLGVRLATDAAHDVELLAGGSIGLTDTALTPAWRGIVGLSYAPRGNDTDHDGVVDADDRCVDQPEDRDDFDDEDGCPDPDNDADSVPDVRDRCANDPEDVDNHEDDDGCPDPDNDADGALDAEDQCPDAPAGDHPDAARAGCPTPDTDGDGVLDPDDRCVDVAAGARPDPERAGCPTPDDDGDGVANRDDACPAQQAGPNPDPWRAGCPDNDPDRDGVAGEADRCPAEPETINGVTDADGCPDAGPQTVTWDAARGAIRFPRALVVPPRAQSLPPAFLPLLQQAAQRVRARGAEVARVFVEVMPGLGAPGAAEAARQAGVVRDVLLAQRIPARLITAQAMARPTPARPVPGRPAVAAPVVLPGALRIRVEARPATPAAATPAAPATPAATPAG